MGRLANKVALVTGASGGQGREEAVLLAGEGAKVALADVNVSGLQETARQLDGLGADYELLELDVTQNDQWAHAIATVRERFGRLDVLINNAGIMAFGGIVSTTAEDWARMIAINQTGPWLGMKHAHPLMRKDGGGSIVNISSVYGSIGRVNATAYDATKAALRGLSRSAANEFAPDGIRVNTVMPGFIDSPMTRKVLDEFGNDHPDIIRTPLKRPGSATEVASTVLFLASEESSYITGAEIVVDGGVTAC